MVRFPKSTIKLLSCQIHKYRNKELFMPRLSLWKDGKHSNDYKFMDRRISEMFTIGGTGVLLNKYLGPQENTGSTDPTKPDYTTQSAQNIQDLLWVENRDRKYDHDVYQMRGIYQRADQDFDLSQFGLFLQTGTIFMVFHLRDMVDLIGRKLIAGDVLELQHLKDYDALNGDLPAALKRYYVVGDASFASEGFSPTWWPHLWRVKLNPLVDSQEYKDIIDNIKASDTTTQTVGKILSTYDTFMNINEAIIAQAEVDVPKSGYDTKPFYELPAPAGSFIGDGWTSDLTTIDVDRVELTADSGVSSPAYKMSGYLTGDGTAPNGITTAAGVAFPPNPGEGDFFLRLDYLPNRLFRFNGAIWTKIEDNVRTNLTPGATDNLTMRESYVNNTNTYVDSEKNTHNQRQPLSRVLTPKADN
jgi:hypothetical protein